MAKHERDDKAKVRFVYLEIEGGSAALQETVRSFAATLARGPAPRPALLAPVTGAQPKTGRTPEEVEVSPEPSPQGSLFDDEQEQDVEEVAMPSRPRPRPIPKPQVVELDLTNGPVSLADYCEQKQPVSDLSKYLVIAAWLKEYRAIPAVTMNEVFTCYKHLGWTVPPDPAQPLRDLKRKSLMSKAEGKGAYGINHLGENEVAKLGTPAQ